MFTSRFLKLPVIMDGPEEKTIVKEIRLNPFCIEAYYADTVSYEGESGVYVTADCVHLMCKNDELHVIMDVKEFEKILDQI